jgi:hypothetical protein
MKKLGKPVNTKPSITYKGISMDGFYLKYL